MKKLFLSVAVLLLFSIGVRADEYYCMFFAADTILPQYPHVWGTFIRMKDKKLVKEVTISWSPEDGWNILDRKKPGRNLSIQESLALSKKKKTAVWGPYQCEEDLYQRAKDKYDEEGHYKMLDVWSKPAVNCIHRLSAITGKRLVSHIRYGKFAGKAVNKHFQLVEFLKPVENKEEIIEALGITAPLEFK